MATIWEKAEHLFSEDNGSLPEVAFAVTRPKLIIRAYEHMQAASSTIESKEPYYWSSLKKAAVPIRLGENPTKALVAGEAEPFHVVFGGIQSRNGLSIPPLGIFCFLSEMAIDYRMGSDWNEHSLLGFFELLDDIATILETDLFVHRENDRDEDSELLHIWRNWKATSDA